MKAKIISVSRENRELCEDFLYIDFDGTRLKAAVGDWAHNIAGGPYKDPALSKSLGNSMQTQYNGGFIGAQVARKVISESEAAGYELVALINQALAEKYKELGLDVADAAMRFTGYIGHVIADKKRMAVTGIGDVRVAVNGKIVAGKTKRIDLRNAQLRADYIRKTGDAEGSHDYIEPRILAQFRFQNKPGRKFSYSAIDGAKTLPRSGVKIITRRTPKRMLIWSDGYAVPRIFTIKGLERTLDEIYRTDPHRCSKYPAVSALKDDRTAVQIDMVNWKRLDIEDVWSDS